MVQIPFRGPRGILVLAVLLLLFAPGTRAQRPAGGAPRASTPASPPPAGPVTRHDLRVTLDPGTSRIVVTDRVTIPPSGASLPAFVLNAKLRITSATPAVEQVALGAAGSLWSAPGPPVVRRYRLRSMPAGRVCTLTYEGPIDFDLSSPKDEYTRGFRQTRGIVSQQGAYLSGETAWYPQFNTGLVRFTMEAKATAAGWHLISQGSGTSRDASGVARWSSPDPMDEIYLVGGPLVVSSRRAGPVEILVYLHKRDDELANGYLATGAEYISMYGRLIGAYPYSKFALIENFWETGYGMPSFTLLGPTVVRLPFILHSSYPHEILHNWWGNSVFVDYDTGNWCEGLTAYLSDHLVQEQRGAGAAHRRDVLQRYRDFVKEGRDFPLAEFRSRDSAATEAVGYGKALMLFHQLRRAMGDEQFTSMLRRLYAQYRGRRASWTDVEHVAEAAGRGSYASFFSQWLSRAGAPSLQVRDVSVHRVDAGYVIGGVLAQVQPGQPYRLTVPVVVQAADGVMRTSVDLRGRSAQFEIDCGQRMPLALNVDPYFDVFRTLSVVETPPSVGQILGEPRVLAVLPSQAPADTVAAYRALMEAWQTDTHRIEVRLDSEVGQLPSDRPVWFLGSENTVAPNLFRRSRSAISQPDRSGAGGPRASGRTLVFIARHPANPDKVVGWILTDNVAALPALARKLPHYSKFSYLAFEGPDAVNRGQGQTSDEASPLRVDLRPPAERHGDLPPVPADPSKSLAPLPEK